MESSRSSFILTEAKASLIRETIREFRRLLHARTAEGRIEAALTIIALARALNVNETDNSVCVVMLRYLRHAGVTKCPQFDTLDDVLSYQFSDDVEIDMAVKAFYAYSALLRKAALFHALGQRFTL
jgi:hypothetical protein